MKKKITICLIFLLGANIYAQVGINKTNPNATLDIEAINTDGSTKEGLLIPRLSKSAIATMGTEVSESTTVFVNYIDTVPDGIQTVTVAHVFEKGFYSFIDGSWKKHNMYDKDIELNKEYVCNNDNIGQILYSTAPGYFICRNEAIWVDENGSTNTATGDPKWEYIGVMEGSAYYLDNSSQTNKVVNITLFQDGDYFIVPAYETISELYGFDTRYPSELSEIGFSDTLPSIGYLVYTYWPNFGCGKQIISGFESNETYMITETGEGSLVCDSDLVKLNLLERHIHFKIRE